MIETPERNVAGITDHSDGRVHWVPIDDSDDALERARDQYEAYRRSAALTRSH